MKIYADMKPKRKVPIHEFVNHQMQKACSCDILEQKGKKKKIIMKYHKLLPTVVPKNIRGHQVSLF